MYIVRKESGKTLPARNTAKGCRWDVHIRTVNVAPKQIHYIPSTPSTINVLYLHHQTAIEKFQTVLYHFIGHVSHVSNHSCVYCFYHYMAPRRNLRGVHSIINNFSTHTFWITFSFSLSSLSFAIHEFSAISLAPEAINHLPRWQNEKNGSAI